MKQIMKKLTSVCAALLCTVTVTVAGAVVVSAEEIDATMKDYMVQTAETLTQTIVPLTDEEIAAYMESGDAFTESAMTAWSSSKEELGALNELGETVVEATEDGYTATVSVDFEKVDAEFVYTFDADVVPTSVSVNVDYPMSTLIKNAGLNTIMGVGIVFLMLLFLSLLIGLFKYIPIMQEKLSGKKKATAPAPAPAPAPVAVPVVEETADDTELIAVIAAAIAAAEGTSTDGFVVRSIRKVNRKRW